jgi:radical SAM protein with 4Fe4S-binding SPASM domain
LAIKLGVQQVNFLPLVPKGFGQVLRLHQVSQVALHRRLDAIYRAADGPVRDLMAGSLSHIISRASAGVAPRHECTAGYRGLFYITPEGDVFTCPNITSAEFSLGNVYRESLLDMMSRLSDLRSKIQPLGRHYGDRYLCTGERLLYEQTSDNVNLGNLVQLQSHCEGQVDTSTNLPPTADRAYCVSRNF